MEKLIERGEVYWINFDPSVGGEIRKTRPAVILSKQHRQSHLNRLQVVPISSKIEKLYPAEAMILLNGEKRKAMADQLTTVSKLRLASRIGKLTEADLEQVEGVVRLQLGMDRNG